MADDEILNGEDHVKIKISKEKAMKKLCFISMAIIACVVISCGIAYQGEEKGKTKEGHEQNNKEQNAQAINNSKRTLSTKDLNQVNPAQNPSPTPSSNNPSDEPKTEPAPNPETEKPVTQFDSEELDNRVRAEAKAMGQDPATYRMFIRENVEDGTKIYRTIGMHVMVSKDGEELYLPDQI